MAETLAQTRLQLQNAESSVLFMQQEHAQTLKGLYAEITKLQKKCGDLTFKLAMNTTSSSTDEGQLQKDFSEAQETIKKLRAENTDFKTIIDTGYKRIVVLETQLNNYEQKYSQDVREREQRIAVLTNELNTKSDTVAYLTTQLHQSKVKGMSSRKQEQAVIHSKPNKMGAAVVSRGGERQASARSNASDDASTVDCVTPSPPSEKAPGPRVRRPFRRSSTSPVPIDVTQTSSKGRSQRAVGIQASPNEIRLNVSSAKSKNKGMPTRAKRAASPPRPGIGISKQQTKSAVRERPPADEYVEFLRTGVRPEPQVVVRAAPEPLPPISATDQLVGTPAYPGRTPRQGTHDEVGKIIVSPLGSPEKGWRHKGHSQPSHGSEL